MALSVKQKQMVYQAFVKIVNDPDSLFNFFVPNTKAQMVALIESKITESKSLLQQEFAQLDAQKTASENRLNNEISIIDDLISQL